MGARTTAPCLVSPDGATLRFAELDDRAAAFAAALLDAGAAAGSTLLALTKKSPDAIALYLACLRAGITYLPANPAYTAAELQHIADDARPDLLVCDPQLAQSRHAVQTAVPQITVLTLDATRGGSLAERAQAITRHATIAPAEDDDVAALLYTSGTTGRAKGVPLSHANLRSNAETLVREWDFRSHDVLVHALPLFHVHGLFVALHCALLAGCSIRLLPQFDADAVRRALHGASVMMGVPTFYARLLALAEFGRADCRSMRLFISGSAPLSEKLFRAFEQRTGQRILERYGMTETNMIASNPLRGERVAGTVGYALPGVAVRVCSGDGTPLAAGETGVLEVRGPNVFRGYRHRPQDNARDFTADGWFRTGDLARMAQDGRITLAGRARDLIISGGYNVYAVEVERCLDACEGVRESAVIGVQDDDLGEAVVAVVVPADPARPPPEPALKAALADRLAPYKRPRRIALRDELPRNTMGKVQKQRLREEYAGLLPRR